MLAKRDGLVAYRTVAVAATIVLGASSIGQSEVLKGQGKAGDWQSDAPGVRHQITMADLPPDLATPSASNGPRVVPAPKNAKPRVPKGFEVALFATGLINPRYLLTAPNGDIFVTESSANTIRVLRDSDGDGRPDINEKFATGLSQPFGLAFYPSGPDPMFLYFANTTASCAFPTAMEIFGPAVSRSALRIFHPAAG